MFLIPTEMQKYDFIFQNQVFLKLNYFKILYFFVALGKSHIFFFLIFQDFNPWLTKINAKPLTVG